MIWTYFFLFVASLITSVLDALHLPKITVLPQILGVDVDSTLINGVSIAHSVFVLLWPLADMFAGALFLLGYFVLKNLALRFFLGNRAPGTH